MMRWQKNLCGREKDSIETHNDKSAFLQEQLQNGERFHENVNKSNAKMEDT